MKLDFHTAVENTEDMYISLIGLREVSSCLVFGNIDDCSCLMSNLVIIGQYLSQDAFQENVNSRNSLPNAGEFGRMTYCRSRLPSPHNFVVPVRSHERLASVS